jgi:hypothetical protein
MCTLHQVLTLDEVETATGWGHAARTSATLCQAYCDLLRKAIPSRRSEERPAHSAAAAAAVAVEAAADSSTSASGGVASVEQPVSVTLLPADEAVGTAMPVTARVRTPLTLLCCRFQPFNYNTHAHQHSCARGHSSLHYESSSSL